MTALLQCLSHSPLIGWVDPPAAIVAEVDAAVAGARAQIAAFAPELVILFAPDHYNGFFYELMPPFCIGVQASAIGDFNSAAGPLPVPQALALECARSVLADDVDVAISYRMQVDHGFAQPLEQLFGGLDACPVIPVFVNGVAPPMPSCRAARRLGAAIGRWAAGCGKRVLFVGSGGLSHEPPVPELINAAPEMVEKLIAGRNPPPDQRAARQERVRAAAERFGRDGSGLHPLNPDWDRQLLGLLAEADFATLDGFDNEQISLEAGRSANETKAWVAAFAAMHACGPYRTQVQYYRPINEWIAGFACASAVPLAT
ncbi:3-carboxyethylcatechol 2,3-dioxygenase [Plasticicumulans acidivorans]|uniref:2,3-dihydroxyphenylpropionate/2,3-dihydroxicinnamic acid 1,2-dioxygenase n=1 Tax=Plasticicumulans acidivorans TaxID=886464 RepID=A0A317MS35_9GAMM|nr:3-carboxyethylcatechol 2,3-dioxygenase [Plasticicumulans acidivorans]PWV59801.1 2,3-dihydroxyphenylpropionate 1,2-dioxygenase [Plasticicumulans acidivorans]